MNCDSDPILAPSNTTINANNLNYIDTPRKAIRDTSTGAATLQAVRMGFSKYAPLLKPQWLLSEPWKAETPNTSSKIRSSVETESLPKGHRRSKASEIFGQDHTSHVIVHQEQQQLGNAASGGTFIDSPPLTAKEDATLVTPSNVSNGKTILGPAFAEDLRASSRLSLPVSSSRRITTATTREARGRGGQTCRSIHELSQSPTTTSRTALFSRRCRKLPLSTLSSVGQGQTRSPSPAQGILHLVSPSSQHVGGLGIVCLQQGNNNNNTTLSKEAISMSPPSSAKNRKNSFDSFASQPQSPALSIVSTVPSIVVTPPPAHHTRRLQELEKKSQRVGVRLDYFEPTTDMSSPASSDTYLLADEDQLVSDTDLLPLPLTTSIQEQMLAADDAVEEQPIFTPGEVAIEMRKSQDDQGLSIFKVAVDAILSEYFVYRTVARTWRLAHQMIQLLLNILSPIESKSFSSSPASWNQDTSCVAVPSLSAQRWIGQGADAVKVSPQWGAEKLQSTMKLVMEHIVTGMVALVTDDRAPYETPTALAHMCLSLQEELPSLVDLHYGTSSTITSKRQAPESPISCWVKACASAESLSSMTSSSISTVEESDEAAWRQVLSEVHPGKVFMTTLRETIQATYEKGETIRSKANLLAVPPPRKGSRKRWQAANAEINAIRAIREKEISQVTGGVITVPEFRRRERKRAAIGNVRDNFAAFFFVRFVGELYNCRVLEVSIIRQWLQRFFFNTVFPGVPSSYELEAGCALLITVGDMLDEDAGTFSPEMIRAGYFSGFEEKHDSSPKNKSMEDDDVEDVEIMIPSHGGSTTFTSTSTLRNNRCDDVPANHWILVSPRAVRELHASCSSHGHLISDLSVEERNDIDSKDKAIAQRTVTATMARLKEILAIREVHAEGRVWCREVLALRNRFWVQSDHSVTGNKSRTVRKLKRV